MNPGTWKITRRKLRCKIDDIEFWEMDYHGTDIMGTDYQEFDKTILWNGEHYYAIGLNQYQITEHLI